MADSEIRGTIAQFGRSTVGQKYTRNAAAGVLFAGAAALASSPACSAEAEAAANPATEILTHMSAAKVAAGTDWSGTAVSLCLPDEPYIVRSSIARPQEPATSWYASPYKVFDNFYWLGTRQHSSWALQTSDGIILIDSNFEWALEAELINGMKRLGLDPASIKYVLIGHAHGDHDQWAAILQRRYGTRVVMGEDDWRLVTGRPATVPGGIPRKDISVGSDGAKITLKETTVTVVATPGHTGGTLSFLFEVKDAGRPVTVAYAGGTGTGVFGTDAARWDQYIESQSRLSAMANAAGATVVLSNHSEFDGAYTKARLLGAKREAGEGNPFIVGEDAVRRYFTVMIECAKASKLRQLSR